MKRLSSFSLLALTSAFIAGTACGSGKPTTVTPAGGDGTAGPVGGAGPSAVDDGPVAVGRPSDDLMKREVLFGNPERAAVKISPDGTWLSWTAAKDGVMNVWVAPIGDLPAAKAITSDTKRPVREYFWAFDNAHIVYMQDTGGDEDFHAFAVDIATGKATDLSPYPKTRAMVAGLSHRKPGTIMILMNDRDPAWHDLYSVDLASGARTLIHENKEKFSNFVVDDDLTLRMVTKNNDDGSIDHLAPTKAGWSVTMAVPAEDADSTFVLGFNKKADAYYLSDTRGRDTGALFTVPFKNGKSGKAKLIAEDARVDLTNMVLHPTENTVEAVEVEYDRASWKVLDKKVAPDFAALAKVTGGDFVIASTTKDNQRWVVVFYSDSGPVTSYLWDRKAQKATFLFSHRPALADAPLVPMHPVEIESRDKLKLMSYLSLPSAADPDGDGKANSSVPMVLLVHGGPWARDSWGLNPLHQLLANRGYAVLSVNFRGSTGFGKSFLNAGNGQWGKKMHDDLIDAVTWAVASGVTSKDKVAIVGGSYGGYSALVGATMTPDVFACAVDIVGPSSILTLLATIPPYWESGMATFKKRVGDWTTDEGKAALLAVSPISHVDAIKRPLLIGQGANDPRVKQSESDQIVTAMKAKKIPVSYVLFPDEGHGFARPENNNAFWGVTEAFLSAHLGGLYQPLTAAELAASTMTVPTGKNGIPGYR